MDTTERRTMSRLMWRLVVFTGILFFFNYLDRVNIGFAALQMNSDLGFSGAVYGLGASIFFIGYAFFEVPSNLILHRVGPRLWLARIMITWGIISIAFAWVSSATQFYILRFLLGVAEAGFVPGIVYYFTFWFPEVHRGKAFAAFFGAANLSSIIGAPISGFVLDHAAGLGGMAGWQWLFLIEGLPSVILGIVILFYLTERPEQAAWLQPEEKQWLIARLDTEARTAPKNRFTVASFLRDRGVLTLTAIYFFYAISVYGVLFWLPLIIKNFGGLSATQIGLLTAVPYLCAFISMQIVGRNSDRTGERRLHIAISALVGAIGLVLSAYAGTPTLAFIFLCVAAIGIWGQNGVFWTLPTRYLTGAAAAGGVAFINCVAQIGGFFGPSVVGWLKDRTDSFTIPLVLLAGASLMVTLFALTLRRDAEKLEDFTAAKRIY
jgi:MFS transporter, ACS family, tartrate transporter